MLTRPLGTTAIRVSILGLGAGQIGDPALSDAKAERLLLDAVDRGITLIDTARSYGLSERRIGRGLGGRRHRVALSTKLGYGVDGVADWTGAAVERGVDDALRALATDVIDIVHLHSCDRDVLARGEVLEALERAAAAGKLRAVAYSGENEALDWALASGRFAVLQLSVNVCDQAALDRVCRPAEGRGVGIIAKRPLANAAWQARLPTGDFAVDEYRRRFTELDLPELAIAWPELAVRFAAFAPGVSSAILGTRSLDHLGAAIDAIERGPLDGELLGLLQSRFAPRVERWPGII